VSERPYKKPFTHEEAMEIIKKDSGTHFDPKIIEAFLNVADDFWIESVNA
jgi:HD-GYP domain-containing protein (c-di-GMP phosphodiesterase class II)